MILFRHAVKISVGRGANRPIPDSPRALGSGAQEDSLRSSCKHPLALLAGTSLRASLTSLGPVLTSAAVAERTAPVNPPRREPHTSPAYCASRRSLRSLLRCSSLAAGPRFTARCARRSASRPLSGRPRTARRRGRTRLAVGRERVPSECEAAQPGEGQAWVGPWRMKGEDRWRSCSRLSRHYSSEARISCSATANDPRASSLVCESNRSADLVK